MREHAAFVQEKIEKLRTLVGECDEVLRGRETGLGFWVRFYVNIAAFLSHSSLTVVSGRPGGRADLGAGTEGHFSGCHDDRGRARS